MTEENYNYRTSPLLLRNQFEGIGKRKMPVIPKANFEDDEFEDLLLIGFDRTKLEHEKLLNRMVHFFLYDYKFERVWKKPDLDIEKLKRYKAVLSPDFSMYLEMAPVMQLYNTFRNRWCGAYFASKGMRVIPTVNWGNENTFDFCFEGIPKGSTVAVSTYMVTAHNNHSDQKEFFLKGYEEMRKRIEPERIICYNDPFAEMEGNIVFVDYERSSWKYQNEDYVPSKYAAYILGEKPLPRNSNLKIKSGHIMRDQVSLKGAGSAYGGKWRPSPKKPGDQRFLGKPGEIKRTRAITKKESYDRDTKIGDDGRAIKERHYTDHGRPWAHTNPHDHIINWNEERGNPLPGSPLNYPDGSPDFKSYEGGIIVEYDFQCNTPEQNRFSTISEFKWCVDDGGEVELVWNDKIYNITHTATKIGISEAYKQETEELYNTAEEMLDYMLDEDRLGDVITQVEVTDRTI